jgi:hypothetical protein
MKKALSATVAGLLWLAFSVGASATTLTIESQDLNVNYGGSFYSDLNGNASASFNVFCVDYQNEVTVPDTFNVNISVAGVSLADTRYGTTTNFSFNSLVGGAPSASFSGAQFGNAYDRYVMAGYLTTLYDFSPGANTGAVDVGIQNAIWTLLDVDNRSFTTGDVDQELQAAVNFMDTNPTGFANLANEVEIFSSTSIAGDNNLNYGTDGDRYQVGQQEMISVNAPEPAVFALVGCGLVLMGMFRRRAAK